MHPRVFLPIFTFLIISFIALPAAASTNGEYFPLQSWTIGGTVGVNSNGSSTRAARTWRVNFDAPPSPFLLPAEPAKAEQERPQAFQYSDAYGTRRKIHMIASYATIPLFVGQYLAGEKLYDGNGSSTAKSVHGALAGGIAALFAVNTVTGVWNLWEARQDPNGKARRLVHGLLMLGADAGFVATGLMAPDDDERGSRDKSAHRTVAITSMGAAAASYVYMLVTR